MQSKGNLMAKVNYEKYYNASIVYEVISYEMLLTQRPNFSLQFNN